MGKKPGSPAGPILIQKLFFSSVVASAYYLQALQRVFSPTLPRSSYLPSVPKLSSSLRQFCSSLLSTYAVPGILTPLGP